MQTPLMTPHQAARALALSPATLATWRCTGRAELPFVKLGNGRVRYRVSDVDSFVAANLSPSCKASQ